MAPQKRGVIGPCIAMRASRTDMEFSVLRRKRV